LQYRPAHLVKGGISNSIRVLESKRIFSKIFLPSQKMK